MSYSADKGLRLARNLPSSTFIAVLYGIRSWRDLNVSYNLIPFTVNQEPFPSVVSDNVCWRHLYSNDAYIIVTFKVDMITPALSLRLGFRRIASMSSRIALDRRCLSIQSILSNPHICIRNVELDLVRKSQQADFDSENNYFDKSD